MVRLFTLNRLRNQTAPLNNLPTKILLLIAIAELAIGFAVPVFANRKTRSIDKRSSSAIPSESLKHLMISVNFL